MPASPAFVLYPSCKIAVCPAGLSPPGCQAGAPLLAGFGPAVKYDTGRKFALCRCVSIWEQSYPNKRSRWEGQTLSHKALGKRAYCTLEAAEFFLLFYFCNRRAHCKKKKKKFPAKVVEQRTLQVYNSLRSECASSLQGVRSSTSCISMTVFPHYRGDISHIFDKVQLRYDWQVFPSNGVKRRSRNSRKMSSRETLRGFAFVCLHNSRGEKDAATVSLAPLLMLR